MKRYFFIIMMMAAAVIASCTKQTLGEEPVIDYEAPTYTYTVSANSIDTKTNYDADGKFEWSAGDAISVLFHNGDVNKFFTLTLKSGDGTNTATFSGEIETGYTVGASDGNDADHKIWALFPASENHTYAGGTTNFYVQPYVDFTESHFSANIPMYALNAEEGTFNFANIACTYKFTVTGIADEVNKVKFQIYNQYTYGLSGSWPIIDAEMYLNYGWASPASQNSTLTYVNDVTESQAVFYVSSRYWGEFKPAITVTNYETNEVIKTFTASKIVQPTSMNSVKLITLDVSADNGDGDGEGEGEGDDSATHISIDGNMSDCSNIETFTTTNSRITSWKVTSDEENIYIYAVCPASVVKDRGLWSAYIDGAFDLDNNSETGGDASYGLGNGMEAAFVAFPFSNEAGSDPTFINGEKSESWIKYPIETEVGKVTSFGKLDGDNTLVEFAIPRNLIGNPASGTTIAINIGMGSSPVGKQTITLK